MKNKELRKLHSFLNDKREYFITVLNDFREYGFASSAPIEPDFNLDLSPLKIEVMKNLSIENAVNTVDFYKGIIEDFKSDIFTIQIGNYTPSELFRYYKDCKSFLDEYYANHPGNDIHGEGQIEYINLCFQGFLYSYQQVIDEVILTIQTLISKHEAKAFAKEEVKQVENNVASSIKQKLTDTELNEIIHKCIDHLFGFNSRQEKIMEDAEFERLFNATFELVKNNNPQEGINPFNLNGITGDSIIYSYYDIHWRIYGEGVKKNKNYIYFLQYCFQRHFPERGYKTILVKFSRKPKKYPF